MEAQDASYSRSNPSHFGLIATTTAATTTKRAGFSAWRAFWWGQLSGMVEPVGGLLGAYAVQVVTPLLPYALSFAAGAMVLMTCGAWDRETTPDRRAEWNGRGQNR